MSCDEQGELEIDLAAGAKRVTYSSRVRLRSLSCEGVALLVEEVPRGACVPDRVVRIRLRAYGQPIMLHGRVAWFEPYQPGRPFNLGVRVEVEPTDEAGARAWADWVYSRIVADRQRAVAIGHALVEVAGVAQGAIEPALERHARTGEPLEFILRELHLCSDEELDRATEAATRQLESTVPADVNPRVRAWHASFGS